MVLLAGAVWWRASRNFDGAAACEESALDVCDATLTGRLAPFVLWPITVIVTVLVLALALQLLPQGPGQRVVWATAIASVVLVANSANPYWAVIVASASLVLVVTVDDERAML